MSDSLCFANGIAQDSVCCHESGKWWARRHGASQRLWMMPACEFNKPAQRWVRAVKRGLSMSSRVRAHVRPEPLCVCNSMHGPG